MSDSENEDEAEKFEQELDVSDSEFVDEVRPSRDTILESSDSDDEAPPVMRHERIRTKTIDKLQLGTTFNSGIEFKKAVIDYALSNARNIEQDRWDKTKISFKCGMGGQCAWRVYCSFEKPRYVWVVKTTFLHHSCTPNGKCKILKSPIIANLFMDKLRLDPEFMPEKIQNHIKEKWKIISTRNQCQRGRNIALKLIDKEYAEQFANIYGYAEEIRLSNPGSTAIVETKFRFPNDKEEFQSFYVCLEILRTSWRGFCRPIIGLDGTFLKVAVKGVLLCAIGHDANNQIYPIAWAVVQAETGDNWLWFLEKLKTDLQLEDGSGYVLISDRSKGLISAVKDKLPEAEHRMCVKHIIENLKKNHSRKELLKPLVWKLAWSYSVPEFAENLAKIQEYDMGLYEAVLKEEPESWSRAYYKLGSCCEDVDNNATESFNASITKARAKPMIPMLETMRLQAMERITKRKDKANRYKARHSFYVDQLLADEKRVAETCKVYASTHGRYQVFFGGNYYSVNMPNNTCSCCKWQVSGIPCEHAYGVIIDNGLDVDDYVSLYFSDNMWRYTYENSIIPLRGAQYWKHHDHRLVVAPEEPNLPGRKKKKKQTKFPRIKGKHESPKKKTREKLSRVGRIMHCSICGEKGHNARRHMKDKDMTTPFSSQALETCTLSETSYSQASDGNN